MDIDFDVDIMDRQQCTKKTGQKNGQKRTKNEYLRL